MYTIPSLKEGRELKKKKKNQNVRELRATNEISTSTEGSCRERLKQLLSFIFSLGLVNRVLIENLLLGIGDIYLKQENCICEKILNFVAYCFKDQKCLAWKWKPDMDTVKWEQIRVDLQGKVQFMNMENTHKKMVETSIVQQLNWLCSREWNKTRKTKKYQDYMISKSIYLFILKKYVYQCFE